MRGYLGLGSNVGDRLANLRRARDALAAAPLWAGPAGARLGLVAASSVYETEPQGEVLDQRDFLNACVAVETDLEPEVLLDLAKRIEREIGREGEGRRHGPRSIDVDLLLLGERTVRSGRLTLPHPDLLRRRFVLVPLLELDPGLAVPDGTALADALARLDGQRVERVGAL